MKIKSLIVLVLTLFLFGTQTSYGQLLNNDLKKFIHAYNYVNTYYVDSVDDNKIIEAAIRKMLEELDPHSIYISKEEIERMNEPLKGSFEGIGIQFNILRDTLLVVATITGGPSEKVGLMAGDQIIEVDNENIAGIGLKTNDVFDYLKGKKGTKVDLKIKRNGVKKLLDFTITRDKIPINSLDAAYLINESTMYVKINRFSATTMSEYRKELLRLKNDKVKNLILDLTNNGGGYMYTAESLADEFLKSGKLIVFTEGLNADKEESKASAIGEFEDGKLVIMIDEGSASASEIVSGAVQDWDRGVLVGRRSFGKGLVQKQFPLPNKSAMRLTIARYHTPTGRVIQKPYDKGVKDYHRDLMKRYEGGELLSADSINFPDSLKYQTLVNKRTVFGGGGIMPDVFVPIDTTHYTDFYRDLIRKGIFYQFVLTEINKNRDGLLSEYPGFEIFNDKFKVTDKLFKDLLSFAKDKKLEPKDGDMDRSKEAILIQLKALYARNLYGYNEFFELINPLDPIFNKAVEIITNDSYYNNILEKGFIK
jgi:carboxyl-terminal processing protease